MENNNDFDDIAKHRKKKPSNTSKSKRKTDHKHSYKEVLLASKIQWAGKESEHYSLGRVCTICGLHRTDKYFITKKQNNGTYLVLDQEEVKEMYKHLDIVEIDDNL